ncbi:BgTH12-05913 [Blumeria graminis f. sp. triticale]|uniref:Bgt-4163 n=3 Tax=Blumeria graminis TaxID=34373 RepID=A0A061HL48_BLUGR|nr:hypothetical protein BGT96224_4163 [Blumeria graminis f. sp. tritici 96224]CAD6504179.1 BgTH12-05913 [Blumeria graminis f. sp. triticale]VDB90951.1 Bgt-4163 [Blumeria graminis f. sp. tritici]
MAEAVRQPINQARLEAYLSKNLPEVTTPIHIKQFKFGQSNPTYQLTARSGIKYVLRKKPPGQLVSSTAHQVKREYQVLHALQNTDVPVPKVYCYCDDERVLGTPFYVMEYLDGRIMEDPGLSNLKSSERHEMWYDAFRSLSKLHRINVVDVGLQDFGKPSGFFDRQIKTLATISQAQATVQDQETKEIIGSIPHLHEMLSYFSDKVTQPRDRNTLIHGDFKIDNLVFHRTEPRVIGILDWEMSTLGHPLSDLVNLIAPYTFGNQLSCKVLPSLTTDALLGLPSLKELIKYFTTLTGWDPTPDLMWGVAFGRFRTTVILQGIASRYLLGQATSLLAQENARARHVVADITWEQILANKSIKIKSSL